MIDEEICRSQATGFLLFIFVDLETGKEDSACLSTFIEFLCKTVGKLMAV